MMKMKGNYANATKLVNLFRLRFSTLSSSHHSSLSRSNHFASTNYKILKFGSQIALPELKILRFSLFSRAFNFQSPFNVAAYYLRNFRFSGSYICSGSILAMSIARASTIAHAMDAGDALVDDPYNESRGLSGEEENGLQLLKFTGKFWLPFLFFITVLAYFDDPIILLFTKVTLFLLSTKPNPFSVYIFVDQLCQQSMRQETQFLQESLYASKVEVKDYKLLCLADIEVRDQKFTLVGILGNWWTLPHLPSWEAFSFVRNRLGSILLKNQLVC